MQEALEWDSPEDRPSNIIVHNTGCRPTAYSTVLSLKCSWDVCTSRRLWKRAPLATPSQRSSYFVSSRITKIYELYGLEEANTFAIHVFKHTVPDLAQLAVRGPVGAAYYAKLRVAHA